MSINTPEWVKNAVFYQIFPDRFARSPRMEHGPGVDLKAWGSDPKEQGYQGGDLYGVTDKLDHIKDLGCNAIYLCPVFSSASNHRYHTFDYYQVDPLLGGNAALRELIDEAHKRDMYIVLDGVFNHASRGFWQFHHILENGGNSPYLDWFIIKDWPLNPYSDDPVQRPYNFEAWAGLPMLPKFNTDNPGVRQFIFDVAKYWIDFGIDGWRLDVPNEIDDDAFWQEFRRIVKGANPEAYIVGEIWGDAQRWLQGDQFDAVMNYTFAWSSLCYFGWDKLRPDFERWEYRLNPLDGPAFADVLNTMHSRYDWAVNHVQMNLLDSHDTARAAYILQNDPDAHKLAILHQMTMPGAPCIYYGTEVGLDGGPDPSNREGFPWERIGHDETGLTAHIKAATGLRHQYAALRTGGYHPLYAEGKVFAFLRKLDHQQALVIYNVGDEEQSLSLDLADSAGQIWRSVWPDSGETYQNAEDGSLEVTVLARAAVVLVTQS